MNIIHAHIKVKEEHRQDFLSQVQTLIELSQAEEGNISYQLYEDVSQTNAFVMVEEWKDSDAVAFHFNTPHFKQFGEISKNYLQEPPTVNRYEGTKK